MDVDRQRVLSEFIAAEMAKTPKTLRIFAVLGLLLCGGGLALLAAVFFDGAATLDDVGPPLVLFGIFTAVSLLGAVWTTARLRSLPEHPLVVALRSRPEDIVRLIPTVIVGRGGRTPALTFELRSGKSQLVIMGERTRAELMAWLSREGAHVG